MTSTTTICVACGSENMKARDLGNGQQFARCGDCMTAQPVALDLASVRMDYDRMKWSVEA